MPERVGVYPGTFDPVTNGHLDVIGRGARLVDRLVIGVARSAGKGPLLALEERVELVLAETAGIARETGARIEAVPFSGLVVEFARAQGATVLLRGLRNVTDFDYEAGMAGMNHRLAPEVETVFLLAGEGTSFIASSLVREIARMGGDISSFVPQLTRERVLARVRPGP